MAKTLDPEDTAVSVPLGEWVRAISTEAGTAAAQEVMKQHRSTCPVYQIREQLDEDHRTIQELKLSKAKLLGWIAGASGAATLIFGFVQHFILG